MSYKFTYEHGKHRATIWRRTGFWPFRKWELAAQKYFGKPETAKEWADKWIKEDAEPERVDTHYYTRTGYEDVGGGAL